MKNDRCDDFDSIGIQSSARPKDAKNRDEEKDRDEAFGPEDALDSVPSGDPKNFPDLGGALARLDSPSLKEATLKAAKDEKAATHVLLAHLVEVDRRWLFAEWGHESLHAYIRDGLGYSDHQAYERASAAKLLRKVPEVRAALESGGHTLTSAARISSHVRRERATVAEVTELLQRCENRSTREIERILVEESTQTAPRPEKIRPVSAELTKLTLEVDAEFMALVERMRELQGNPAVTLQELFRSAIREYTKKREPKDPRESKTAKRPKESSNPSPPSENSEPIAEGAKPVFEFPKPASENPDQVSERADESAPTSAPQKATRSRHIPKAEENVVRLRSGSQCEYVDPASGKRCDGRIGLQLDHYPIPFAMDGPNIAENLREVCPTHNRFHAIRAYGSDKMGEYFRA